MTNYHVAALVRAKSFSAQVGSLGSRSILSKNIIYISVKNKVIRGHYYIIGGGLEKVVLPLPLSAT